MRLVFMGTPDFAVPALAALVEAGHEIACVYSQPPRPAGRGQAPRAAPVQLFAEARGIPTRCPRTLRDAGTQADFAALNADAAVVAAYGLILPQPVLDAPRLGCLNIHASLLPRWRGAAPIQRAILAGDAETGVTIMQMDAGLDTGPMLLREAVPITNETTAGELHDMLAPLGARLIVPALEGLAAGTLRPEPQPAVGMTYAPKLGRADGELDWRRSAAELARQVRALTPWPGTWFTHLGQPIKVLRAIEVDAPAAAPGTVLDDRLTIACSDGALQLLTVQRAGRAPMDAAAFLRGYLLPVGTLLRPVDDPAAGDA
jgi:methionyl-tRNA formyltransferase